jgi:hypothetical protein
MVPPRPISPNIQERTSIPLGRKGRGRQSLKGRGAGRREIGHNRPLLIARPDPVLSRRSRRWRPRPRTTAGAGSASPKRWSSAGPSQGESRTSLRAGARISVPPAWRFPPRLVGTITVTALDGTTVDYETYHHRRLWRRNKFPTIQQFSGDPRGACGFVTNTRWNPRNT